MDTQSAEKNHNSSGQRERAAIGIIMESCWVADMATLISDGSSEQRAFPIEIEVRGMSCSRCRHVFPVGFYCIECGYVPTGQEN